MELVLKTDEVEVYNVTPEIELQVSAGIPGARGSLIFVGDGDPNLKTEEAITGNATLALQAYDVYIDAASQLGYQYQTNETWTYKFSLSATGFEAGAAMRSGTSLLTTDAQGYGTLTINDGLTENWTVKWIGLTIDQAANEIGDPGYLLQARVVDRSTVNEVNVHLYRTDGQPFQTTDLSVDWSTLVQITTL